MTVTEIGAKTNWVRLRDVAKDSLTESVIRLRAYRPTGLWEVRNGEIWVNAERFSETQTASAAPSVPLRQPPSPPAKRVLDIDLRAALMDSEIVRWEWSDRYDWDGGRPHVYFIECQGFVKIGVAKWPYKRMTTMQGGNPFPLTLWGALCPLSADAFAVESGLHRWFCKQRHSLEWFHSEVLLELSRQILVDDDEKWSG